MALPRVRPIVVLLAVAVAGCSGAVAGNPDVGGAGGGGGDGGTGPGGAGGCAPAETRALTPLCRADGWCWIDPYPQGHALSLADGSGPDDVWFAGASGTVLRHGPAGFSLDPFPSDDAILRLGVVGPDDAWAVTAGAKLLHRDANGWQEVQPGEGMTIGRLFASPAAGVWVRGYQDHEGVVLRRTATGWEEIARGLDGPEELWASGPDDAWFAETYRVLRWDGTGMTPIERPQQVRSISGTGPEDVWLVERFGELWHWNGVELVQVEAPDSANVRAAAADDVWLWGRGTVAHGDGVSWQDLVPPFTPRSLWPEGGGRAWIAGAYGEIARWDGSEWVRLDRRLGPLRSLDVDATGRVQAVGPGGRLVGIEPETLLATVADTGPGAPDFAGVLARKPDDLWVFGGRWGDEVARWDGCRLSPVEVRLDWYDGASSAGGAIFAAGAADGGTFSLHRHDGTAWSSAPLPGRATAVHAISADEAVVAVTTEQGGAVVRWDHGSLAPFAESDVPLEDVLDDGNRVRAIGRLYGGDWDLERWVLLEGAGWLDLAVGEAVDWTGVWAAGPEDVWLIDAGGDLVHWDGGAFAGRHARDWMHEARPFALGGSGADDVWFLDEGSPHAVRRWDGTRVSWLPRTPDAVWAIRPLSGGEAWAAGRGLFHFDGTDWSEPFRPDLALYALWASGPSDVWTAGAGGVLLHFDGTAWTERDSGTTDGLVVLAGTGPSDVWAAGVGGTVLHFDGAAWSTVVDLDREVTSAAAFGDALWLAASDGTLLRIEAGAVVHEEQTGLAIAGLVAFGADDVWIAGRAEAGVGASLRHWDGDRWTGHDAGISTLRPDSRLLRWNDATWIVADGRLRELGPEGRTISSPANGLAGLRGDSAGNLWGIGLQEPTGSELHTFLLRYRPPAD